MLITGFIILWCVTLLADLASNRIYDSLLHGTADKLCL
jgi:hypothetical protein